MVPETASAEVKSERESELRSELRELVCSFSPAIARQLDDHTSLIASGIIDSQSLFSLVVWIESKSGHPVDPVTLDFAREFDTMDSILRYLVPTSDPAKAVPGNVIRAPRRSSGRRIVGYTPEFKDAIVEFQKGLWSPDGELNRRYFEWKYEATPYADQSRLYLAFDGDELIGMRGFFGSRWEVGSPTCTTPLLVADDLLVSPRHRNQRLVRDIMMTARDELRSNGERHVLNLSAGSLTVLESMASGWKNVAMLDPLVRRAPTGLGSIIRRVRAKIGSQQSGAKLAENAVFGRLDSMPKQLLAGSVEIEIDTQPRVDGMADLVQRIGHDGRCRHLRDETFLQWRYKNPLHEYRFLYATGDPLKGFLVVQQAIDASRSSRKMRIVDLEGIDERVKFALLDIAVRAGMTDITVWGASVSDETRDQLFRLGFRTVDAKVTASEIPYLLVWLLDEVQGEASRLNGVNLLTGSNWDMRMIYSMVG